MTAPAPPPPLPSRPDPSLTERTPPPPSIFPRMEVTMFTTREFWRRTCERAVKTAAQTAVAMLTAGAVDVLTVDWQQVASVSAGAAIVSVLTSLASTQVGDPDDPSLVD